MSSTKNIQKKIPSKPVPNPKSKITKQKKSLSQNKKRIKMNHPKKFLAKSKEEYQNQIQVMIPVMKKF